MGGLLGRLEQLLGAANFQFSTIFSPKIALFAAGRIIFLKFFLNFGESVFCGELTIFVWLGNLAEPCPFGLAGVLAFLVLVFSCSIVGVVVGRGGSGVCGRGAAAF